MAGVVLVLFCCVVTIGVVIYLYKYDKINGWVTSKREISWTTFYFNASNRTHIHLVPLDRIVHETLPDGDCRCRTKTIDCYPDSDNVVVYQHERVGV